MNMKYKTQNLLVALGLALCLDFAAKVHDIKCPEDGDVPDVDDGDTEGAGHQERERNQAVVREGLVVHENNNADSEEKGDQVDPSSWLLCYSSEVRDWPRTR